MSESFWESEGDVEAKQEVEPESAALAVSADDFAALEERVLRAVNLVKLERQARVAAEAHAAQAEAQLREQALQVEQLQRNLSELKTEREQVRKRVDKLLAQFDALEI